MDHWAGTVSEIFERVWEFVQLVWMCFAHLLWCPVWGVNNDPIYDNFVSYAIIMFWNLTLNYKKKQSEKNLIFLDK